MASANSFRFLTLAIMVIFGALILENSRVSADCQIDIPGLIAQCKDYVKIKGPKVPPSQGCCGVVTKLDIPCVCKLVTPEIEKIVSMDKVVYVARTCGLTVPAGLKCGSYVVPPRA
ncbi:hypothetical protein COLO4_36502 [Corchorus olitorius]|uniref:Bifunctional inhibitor/plant lipid transfer protein/seed storage helical domain-containing protein n=1 Tax=Corchorus olitorius TaxID=93759 RepID=A0A1R3G8J4_9ROSI|nr:hypothetical protein COLO4_36502 [Corchorus olitorius]